MENAHIASSMSCLVEASGVYFQWKKESFGPMRMEVVVKSAAIVLRKGFRGCEEDRGIRGAAGSGRGVRTIVDGLDVLYHQSFCPVSLHSNMTVKIPYRPYDLHPDARDPSTGFAEMPLDLPAVVPKGQQTIVQPTVEPNVNIGIEPTLLITSYEDILKIAACILVFLGPQREPSADEAPASADADADADADAEWPTPSTPEYRGRGMRSEARAMLEREDTGVTAEYSDSESGVEEEKTPGWLEDGSAADEGSDTPSATAHAAGSEDGAAGAEESPEGTSTIIVHIQNLSVCVVDPVLGLHLPVARLMVTSASAVIDRLQDDEYELRSYTQEELSEMALLAEDADQATLQKKLFEIGHDERKALNVCVQLIAYGEYFNNTIRCWEILLEPIEAELLYEVCEARGTGIILRMPSVLHLNARRRCSRRWTTPSASRRRWTWATTSRRCTRSSTWSCRTTASATAPPRRTGRRLPGHEPHAAPDAGAPPRARARAAAQARHRRAAEPADRRAHRARHRHRPGKRACARTTASTTRSRRTTASPSASTTSAATGCASR